MPNPALYWIVVGFLILAGMVSVGSMITGATSGAIIVVMIAALIIVGYMGVIPGMPKYIVWVLILIILAVVALFAPTALSEIAKIIGFIPIK